MGKAIGAVIGLLGLAVAVLTWLFPDPLAINDKVEPAGAHRAQPAAAAANPAA